VVTGISGLTIEVSGEGHDIVVDPSARMAGAHLRVKGAPVTVRIGPRVVGGKLDIEVTNGGRLEIGADTTFETAVLVAQASALVIGEDCLIAGQVEIRTSDRHAIYDLDTGQRVNPDRAIRIGDHVWLGKYVLVLKGATIGSGSVVGTRSLVTGTIPPLSTAAGSPARVLRSGTIWTRKLGAGDVEADAAAMKVVAAVRRQEQAASATTTGPRRLRALRRRIRRLIRGLIRRPAPVRAPSAAFSRSLPGTPVAALVPLPRPAGSGARIEPRHRHRGRP
jgi:acetyltransferase-like isoleucine patch superfamily enzyme